jgi:multidrug resistance efflux pump
MPKTAILQARLKRKAGETLTEAEEELLRTYDRQYVKRQIKITLTEEEVKTYGDRARSEGFDFATWLAVLVRLGAQGGFVSREAMQRLEEAYKKALADNERLRLENAEQQIRLSGAQKLVNQYQEEFRQLALAVPRGV